MYLQIDGLAIISMALKEINALVVDALSDNDTAIHHYKETVNHRCGVFGITGETWTRR